MPAKFVLRSTNEGRTKIELLSAQGQRLLSSELYDSKQAARNAIANFRKAVAEAEIEDSESPQPAAKKSAAKKSAAKKASAKKAGAKKSGAKKSGAKKSR